MRIKIFDDMTECTDAAVQRMLPLVSAQRREQALRYKHTLGQFCCLKSWLMLFEDVEMSRCRDLEWKYNQHGKPYIEGAPYFSISHCKEGIAVAINDTPIGIDIEGIRHADESLIERVMNEEECQQLTTNEALTGLMANDQRPTTNEALTGLTTNDQRPTTNDQLDRAFTRLWTRKEAVVKAQGVGIESFEQLQNLGVQSTEYRIQTFEKENYIYSIAYGKLCSFGAEIQTANL